MAAKRYISTTGVKYTFLISVNGKTKSISFKGTGIDCIIQDMSTQKAVEESDFFKDGRIDVAPGTTAGGFDEEIDGLAGEESSEDKLNVKRSNSKTKSEEEIEDSQVAATTEDSSTDTTTSNVREDITDYQSAREVLMGEPYNLTPQAVSKSPESILKKASELGVSFPNLPTV